MKMRRIIAGLVVSVFMAVVFLSLGTGSASAAATKFRLAHINAAGSTLDKQAQKFKEIVESQSGGKIKVDVYPASQLGKMAEVLEGMSMGTIDLCFESYSWLFQFNKDLNFFGAPFLVQRVEEITEHPELWKILDQIRVKNNIRVLAMAGLRPQMHLWTRTKPVKTLEELQGVKIRVPPIKPYVDTWNGLGAIAVAIPFSELYMALAQNVVDGIVHNASQVKDQKFDELLKYATLLSFKPVINSIMMNEKKYQSLSPDLQKLMVEATKKSGEFYDQLVQTEEKKAWDAMEKAGLKVFKVDRDPWFKKAKEVLRKSEESGAWKKGLLDTLK